MEQKDASKIVLSTGRDSLASIFPSIQSSRSEGRLRNSIGVLDLGMMADLQLKVRLVDFSFLLISMS